MQAKTPLLKQYFDTKQSHPGILIAMRVGDFYEFYGEDALTAAKALEITLTGKEDGSNGRIPMAGVPFHALEKYIARLLKLGLKVGICDQLEDPKQAKGLVKRGVTRILTPGTVLEDSMLSATKNNFLAAICVSDDKVGLAMLDPRTGEFLITEIPGNHTSEKLLQELSRLQPSELLLESNMKSLQDYIRSTLDIPTTNQNMPSLEKARISLEEHFQIKNLQGFGCADKSNAIIAASMALSYVKKNGLPTEYIQSLSMYSVDDFMSLDLTTKKSLEITQNASVGTKAYTLLEVMDKNVTVMGSRLLKRWLDQPLLNKKAIQDRLDTVDKFVQEPFPRGMLRDALNKFNDIERLVSRIATALASPRDLAALRSSIKKIPNIKKALLEITSNRMSELKALIEEHNELLDLLTQSIVEEPPHTLREGGVIAKGYDLELDKLRSLSKDGKQYIANLEQKERLDTGISALKVGYNSVFGYYIEVSKIHLSKVPSNYIRKQTTANAERYITAELKEHESAVLGAEQKAQKLEVELFNRIRNRVAEHSAALLQTARGISELDVLSTLAEIAIDRHFIKPELVEEDILLIKAGRHPVVESFLTAFVPNDTFLGLSDKDTHLIKSIILTGPNMSGKSTYLRQNALIILMAQMGSFVPAQECKMGLFDRIFARIGAKDELALGQSTFMVEMIESANILNNATKKSFVILDEIGRGTSTYDGLAIAWSITEYLAQIGCKTMFATHYHQLNALAEQIPEIANFRVSVEEIGSNIIWTHRVLPGGTDRSYGIHVARMAGMPSSALSRAQQILDELEGSESLNQPLPSKKLTSPQIQLTLFDHKESELIKALQFLELNKMTPLEAITLLNEWKSKYIN